MLVRMIHKKKKRKERKNRKRKKKGETKKPKVITIFTKLISLVVSNKPSLAKRPAIQNVQKTSGKIK